MNTFQAHYLEEGRIDTMVVQMKQARHYCCIPLPPGCIPTELITEESQRPGFCPTTSLAQYETGQRPVQTNGSKHTGQDNQKSQRETFEQDGVLAPVKSSKQETQYANHSFV